jgi:hypothetical protein
MANEIIFDIAIRSVTEEKIEQSEFAKLKITYLDDNSEGELWIPKQKATQVGLTEDMVEDRETQRFPIVQVTLVPAKYKRTKLQVAKLQVA